MSKFIAFLKVLCPKRTMLQKMLQKSELCMREFSIFHSCLPVSNVTVNVLFYFYTSSCCLRHSIGAVFYKWRVGIRKKMFKRASFTLISFFFFFLDSTGVLEYFGIIDILNGTVKLSASALKLLLFLCTIMVIFHYCAYFHASLYAFVLPIKVVQAQV